MQNLTFTTDGTWENTALWLNGQQISARRLTINLETDSEGLGRGGLDDGGNITAAFWTENPNNPNTLDEHAIFPGTFSLQVMKDGQVTWDVGMANMTHDLDFGATSVTLDGLDASKTITRLVIDVNPDQDKVEMWYKYLSSDNGVVASYEETTIF